MEYKSQNVVCQNCKSFFTIEPDDFGFYEKIKVPPPTFCPECRVVRRMSFLNERTLYKRKCDMTGESIISLFPENAEVPVYSPKAWWSDNWDAISYGQDYDFSRPFFQQFGELLRKVPQFSLQNQYTTLIRTEYVNMGTYNKDCYLVFNTSHSEESSFTAFSLRVNKCFDIYYGNKSELCYECQNINDCHNVRYSQNCEGCVNVFFSRDLFGCNDCFGSSNLRKKSYYIFNKPYTRETYLEEMKKYDLSSHIAVEQIKKYVANLMLKFPRRFNEGVRNVEVSGNYMYNSKSAHNSFYVNGLEDGKYCQFVFYKPSHDCYDMTLWGQNATRIYECMGAGDSQDMIKFSFDCWAPAVNIEYSYHIVSPNRNLFGCIGLKNKEYCILNKQYSKEEYEKMVEKIKKHMDDMPYVDKRGVIYKYGEFFPSEISLFSYNETFANSYFPLEKEEAIRQGFKWKDIPINKYEITIKASELPDDIKDVNKSILNQVIECEISKRAFRITQSEYQFYKQMNISLPRLHPDERNKNRLKRQNPMKLWHRECMCHKTDHHNHTGKCEVEFETSYAPDRPDIVYCEKCYQQEIY